MTSGDRPEQTCGICNGRIEWLDPGNGVGGWWAHERHPSDGHDAVADLGDRPEVRDEVEEARQDVIDAAGYGICAAFLNSLDDFEAAVRAQVAADIRAVDYPTIQTDAHWTYGLEHAARIAEGKTA